ncbi:lmo0937 family membrane protein [Psychroserpens sp. AS72]|uniref:lmo0937 family membrane protein n=1 Tax=Psychroserpens sp. AS72 TaxID=3135775 RepID=UPI00318283FB
MKLLTYFIIVILVILWAVGYFVYGSEHLIHILLVSALLLLVYSSYKNKSNDNNFGF